MSEVIVTGSAVPSSPLPFLVDSQLKVEKVRVSIQVRHSHLARNNRVDKDTDKILKMLEEVEAYIDGRVAEDIQEHPAYPWFSRVKGVGNENIGKVVGFVRIKPSDEFVCHNRECRMRIPKESIEPPLCPNCNEQLFDPPYAHTVSGLWKYAGYDVTPEGTAPKRVRGGGVLEYNSDLRTMCYRLGTSLMKGGGNFYEYYSKEKSKLKERYFREGKKIVPANKLPKKNGKSYEPKDMISEGHVHMQAFRKMIKLFLSCLWSVWREAEGLPTRIPYPMEYLGHETIIDPWTMVDREAKKTRKKKTA